MAHTTKYGNKYSNQEWTEMQAGFAAEAAENEDFLNKMAGMKTYLRRQLSEMGVSEAGINALTGAFVEGRFDEANYQFTNGRRAKVNGLWDRWNKALN